MKTVIENKSMPMMAYLRRVFRNNSLTLSFFRKEVKAKYVQTKIGVLWILAQPLLMLLVFTVFFDKLIQLDTGNVPYPVFAFSGMTIWYFFSKAVIQTGNSLIQSSDVIKKVYFPRLIFPLSKLLVELMEMTVFTAVLFILMIIYGIPFQWKLVMLPVVIFMISSLAFCVGIWLSVLSIRFRDLHHIVPHIVNSLIWLTPVFYPVSLIPDEFKDAYYYVNPVATTIDLFRSILFDLPFNWMHCSSFLVVFALLYLGILRFKNAETQMSDYL